VSPISCNLIIRTFEELLLKLSLCDFNLDGFVDLLVVAFLVVGVVLDSGGEEGVDEGSLSETRLASNLLELAIEANFPLLMDGTYHDGEGSSTLCDNLVPVEMLGGS
jgi:hypothetical protein